LRLTISNGPGSTASRNARLHLESTVPVTVDGEAEGRCVVSQIVGLAALK